MGALERISVDVPSEVADALRQTVKDGGWECEGQVVAAALEDWGRIQQSDEEKLACLRRAVDEGDQSGPGIPADQVFAELEELVASFKQKR